MKDRLDILHAYRRFQNTNKRAVLATVVKVHGSTYRRPGARMLIAEDGETVGLISGGCLDTDLLSRAHKIISSEKTETVTFDTTSPDDLVFGLGLGCTGVAHVLLEPVQPHTAHKALDFIESCTRQEEPGLLASIFRVEGELKIAVGSHVQYRGDDMVEENIKNPILVNAILEDIKRAAKAETSLVRKYQLTKGYVEALVEYLAPPLPLLVCAGGPDVLPLIRMAKELGWHTTVVDKRPAPDLSRRFPEADVALHSDPEDLAATLPMTSSTFAVVMTHNYESDLLLLKTLFPSPVRYIGLLGPTKKRELLLQKLREEGVEPTPEQLARLHNPAGIDLGAETPEEIALAIVAEIRSVVTGRPAGFLRDRPGPIH